MKSIFKGALNGATSLNVLALAASTVGLLAAQPAFAQAGSPVPATASTGDCIDSDSNGVCDSAEAGSGDAIVVTGSRISRSNFNSPSPITVITKNDASVAGFNSAAELLQSTAVTAGARQIDNTFTGFITDGGPGANTLSLRGLGVARTLILLNGRRLAPSGTSGSILSADLNVPAERDRQPHRSAQGRRIVGLWFGRGRRRRQHHHRIQGRWA